MSRRNRKDNKFTKRNQTQPTPTPISLPVPATPVPVQKYFEQKPQNNSLREVMKIIFTVGLTLFGTWIYQKITTGPNISMQVISLAQRHNKNETVDSPVLFIISASIYNKGDKKFFIQEARCELKKSGTWIKLYGPSSALYDLDALNGHIEGSNQKIGFDPMYYFDTLSSVPADFGLNGRFFFFALKNPMFSDSEPIPIKIILTDDKGKEHEFLDGVAGAEKHFSGEQIPRTGWKFQ